MKILEPPTTELERIIRENAVVDELVFVVQKERYEQQSQPSVPLLQVETLPEHSKPRDLQVFIIVSSKRSIDYKLFKSNPRSSDSFEPVDTL